MPVVLWPNGLTTPGDVWHEYGPRAPIWTPNGPTSSFHSGIDIGPWGGKGGTWLLSPVDGEVTHAAYDDIFGNRVVVSTVLDGDDVAFWLCHGRTGSMRVSRGETVSQKQPLQLMGETGKASGVHIHFEVHVNGTRVDPRAFYSRPHTGAGASGGESVKTKLLFKEETMEFFNIQGMGGSHNAGLFATYRKNSDGTLVAKRLTRTIVAGYPTIPNEGLVELKKAMPFIDL